MKETAAKKKGTRVAGARTSDVGAYWAQVEVVIPQQFGDAAGRELSKGLTPCALP